MGSRSLASEPLFGVSARWPKSPSPPRPKPKAAHGIRENERYPSLLRPFCRLAHAFFNATTVCNFSAEMNRPS